MTSAKTAETKPKELADYLRDRCRLFKPITRDAKDGFYIEVPLGTARTIISALEASDSTLNDLRKNILIEMPEERGSPIDKWVTMEPCFICGDDIKEPPVEIIFAEHYAKRNYTHSKCAKPFITALKKSRAAGATTR